MFRSREEGSNTRWAVHSKLTLDRPLSEAVSTRSPLSAMNRKRLLAIVAGVLVLGAGLGVLGFAVSQRLLGPEGPPPAAAAAPSPAPRMPPGFVEFRHPPAGFALGYPADWRRLPSSDPQVVLVAARNAQESFLVRVAELESPVGPQELPAVKPVTDQIVKANQSVQLLAEPAQIELGGLPGYFYFYSFADPGSGQRGVHSHFFVFKERKMITLVFQALPVEHFPRVAPTFDQITSSFRVLEK